ncbi:MAG: ABC transporter ATP-binding protein [Verrucomicrobia bacterium]|nr:ABC transporter ATP-binding protein [Verrucomicrobiota bacterium]
MNAIEANHLGKAYRKGGIGPPTLFGTLSRTLRGRRHEEFWALQDVSFAVESGRTVGVIGPNGSGKSSLLGLVAGTITPTRGTVRTEGRLSSLLELGAGFHPDLSGRENVFLNAALLGIAREDVRRRYDHIVAFAGLSEFMDMPVKHYSSGMYVRLGFAVATELNPDVLLVDEVLAVGDIAFQLKCLDRIRDFQRRGKTLLLVSHALQTVEEFCHEAFLLYHGKMVARGDPPDVILAYMTSYMGEGGYLYRQEFGTREVEFTQVTLRGADEAESATFTTGRPVHVDVGYRAKQRIESPVFGFSIKTGNGLYVFGSNTQMAKTPVPFIEGEGVIRLTLDPLTLKGGNFFLSLSIHSPDHATQYHRREDWYPFVVKDPTETPGLFALHSAWRMLPGPQREL